MIKKCLLLAPVTLLPYGIIFMGYLFFTYPDMIGTVFGGNPLFYFAALLAMVVFAAIVTCIALIVGFVKKWDCVSMARAVMIVKLIHIPAYILIFVCGLIFSITIFLFAANIFLVILDCVFIFMTGALATASVVLAVQQKSGHSPVLCGLFCCNLFCA